MATSMGNQPPIIVIKKVKGHGGHHGGAWKVAYADFVTAMMSLFIVLWLMASSEEVKKAVSGYFQDPAGTGKLQGTQNAGLGDALSIKKEDLSKLQEQLQDAMRELPEMRALEKNVQITITQEGLRIELLEKEGGLWFDSGSSSLSGNGRDMFAMLGAQLKGIPNKLVIEGHTDAKPYSSTTGYTNWELSADRANTARRVLLEAGVTASQVVQIRGFAEVQLRNNQDPFDPANRRVSVIVQYREVPPKPGDAAKMGEVKKSPAPAPAHHSSRDAMPHP